MDCQRGASSARVPELLCHASLRRRDGKPAHSHPNGEELIYVISGEGKVYVDGEIGSLLPGVAVLFPKGSIHMVRNSGSVEMKVICFFAPATDLEQNEFPPEVSFPEKS